jgi:hypothetical protein
MQLKIRGETPKRQSQDPEPVTEKSIEKVDYELLLLNNSGFMGFIQKPPL